MAENQDQQQQQQPPPQNFPALIDIDSWLHSNGLRSAADDPQQEYASFMSESNKKVVHEKLKAHDEYQKSIHDDIFKKEIEAEQEQQRTREKLLESWNDHILIITTTTTGSGSGDGVVDDHPTQTQTQTHTQTQTLTVPLRPLASSCDTIFTLASSRRYADGVLMQQGSHFGGDGGGETKEQKDDNNKIVRLSLEEYSTESVQEFLDLVLKVKSMNDINGDYVVDCCHMSHYLQCKSILMGCNAILLSNIDNENCLSLCQMADQLELPDLFERSLFHMLKSLNQLETTEAYEAFSPELKSRIKDIRSVFTTPAATTTSSAKQRRKQATLYFTSLGEYIAIFAETVQYHRERLEEAKLENTGRQYNSYAQNQIEKQELRVLTLEAMLQEQKRMFSSSNNKKRMKI